MLRTIIIDDEAHMRQSLEKLVKDHCPNIKLIAKADGVETGHDAIKKHQPDLVFLDIKMNDGTGFDLLKRLEPIDFKVIFITAYDEYAIRAIKFSALDYLLKPVGPGELKEAVERAKKVVLKELNTQLSILEDDLQSEGRKKIILKTFDSIHLVKVSEIIYCKSDNNYTEFYLLDQNKIVVSQTLKEYEEILSDFGFFRVHQSYLINLIHILRFDKAEGGSIVLTNNHKAPVASRKKDQLLELLNRISSRI